MKDKINKLELIIIRGLPGSGKTTYAKSNFPNHIILEPDHLFMDLNGNYLYEAQIWDEAVSFIEKLADFSLSRKKNVVVCDVFPTLNSMNNLQKIAEFHKASVVIKTTDESFNSVHDVPLCIIEKMKILWEDTPEEVVTYCPENKTYDFWFRDNVVTQLPLIYKLKT